MTQREKDDELQKARVHVQFVCRMYRLQHEEGRYFLHEHRESELPRRKIASMKLRKRQVPKKPPPMMADCLALAFTLNRRYPKHLESSEHCRSEHKNI